MRQATKVHSREFDAVFFKRPPHIREMIESKAREMGQPLQSHHHCLHGRSEFRLRAADHRIIYEFDVQKNELPLITLGHRREIYRH